MLSLERVKMPKDFLILLVAAFFMYTYNNVFMMAMPLLFLQMGSTETLAGLQSAIFIIAAICLRFFFGLFADVHGKCLTLIIGSISFLLAAVLLCYAQELWQILVLRLIQAIGLAAFFPAATALTSVWGGSSQKGTYIGILRIVASLSLMIGPVFALYIIKSYSYITFLYIMASMAFLGTLIILLISEPKQVLEEKNPMVIRKPNFIHLLRNSTFIIGSTFVAAISYGILMSFAAVYIEEYTNIINAGFFFTFFSLGGIIANGFFGWFSDRYGRSRLTTCAFASLGIGIIMFALLPRLSLLYFAAGFMAGAGYYGSIVVLLAWMAEKVKINEHTSALSLQQNALDLGIAAGSGMFGYLLVATSRAELLYGFLGLFYLSYAWICFTFVKGRILKE